MIRSVARVCCALALAVGAGSVACGKKGPPVAPSIRIPAAVQKVDATRVGDDVYVSVTVPATNIDESIPVDLQRVDIYAYTGRTAPAASRFSGLGTLVASIPVAPVPRGDRDTPPPPPDPSRGAIPGAAVTIVDTLEPAELVQGPIYVDPRRPDPPVPATSAADGETGLRRFYAAVPFSLRGRPGPPGAVAELVLASSPDPPTDLRLQYDASAISLAWQPSGGILGFLLDRVLPPEPPPFVAAPQPSTPGASQAKPTAAAPSGATTYNVYRQLSADPFALPQRISTWPWNTPVPVPINAKPLPVTSATDPVTPGREHCYVVRAQRGSVLSAASPRACIRPIDVFPPAAPTGLAAVPSEGGISLIWEPGSELDLGGYLILRREPGDDTLRQLTAAPVGEARYRDTDVQPGKRYIYSVVAVDSQVPLPNVSAESARVEETAR